MRVVEAVALVSGANGGIGRAFVEALRARGARRIYAAVRDRSALAGLVAQGDEQVRGVVLDVTDRSSVAAAAALAGDVNLLLNNAGVNHNQPLIRTDQPDAAREEIEVNYLGLLNMCRAFAPVLAANGGGCMVNMLSILARVNLPLIGSLAASKAAAWSLTQGVRAEMIDQGTRVMAVLPGPIDTRMTADFPGEKMPPAEAVRIILDALEAGEEDVYVTDMALELARGLAADHKAVEHELAGMRPGLG